MSSKAKKPPKKLRDFFSAKADSSKKFRAAAGYCDSGAPVDEVRDFLRAEVNEVWRVLLDTFQGLLGAPLKDKLKAKHADSVGRVLSLLKQILVLLPEKIAEKWQGRGIGHVLQQILFHDHPRDLKVRGIELSLLFIEAQRARVDSDTVLQIFASVIDMRPFIAEYHTAAMVVPFVPPQAASNDGLLILTEAALRDMEDPEVQRADAVAMLDCMLVFMSGRSREGFEYLWTLFKWHYCPVLFPDLCRSMRFRWRLFTGPHRGSIGTSGSGSRSTPCSRIAGRS